MIVLKIDPVAKPRMTRRDTWAHRPVVDKYFSFKDKLVILCKKDKFVLPDKYRVEFYIKMPSSWSVKRRCSMLDKPHQQKPDLDNLIKSVNDCLLKEDSTVWYVEAMKCWWEEGKIIIYTLK